MEKYKEYIKYAVILIVVFLIYKIAKIFEKEKQAEETIQDISKKIDTKKLSFTDISYINMANSLYNAMRDSGTNEAQIFAVLNACKNDMDFYRLFEKFGVRKYVLSGDTLSGAFTFLFGSMNLDLFGWFEQELSEADLERVRLILRKINIIY